MTKYRPISPFLCMDMTYITCLLKEGFGFKDSTVLQVSGKYYNLKLYGEDLKLVSNLFTSSVFEHTKVNCQKPKLTFFIRCSSTD